MAWWSKTFLGVGGSASPDQGHIGSSMLCPAGPPLDGKYVDKGHLFCHLAQSRSR